MDNYAKKITFFSFLMPSITAGEKTITIRDETERNYEPGSVVGVFTLETDRKVCDIRIESVEPLRFEDIGEFHARQESMELGELKRLIREIYPDTDSLYMISFNKV